MPSDALLSDLTDIKASIRILNLRMDEVLKLHSEMVSLGGRLSKLEFENRDHSKDIDSRLSRIERCLEHKSSDSDKFKLLIRILYAFAIVIAGGLGAETMMKLKVFFE